MEKEKEVLVIAILAFLLQVFLERNGCVITIVVSFTKMAPVALANMVTNARQTMQV